MELHVLMFDRERPNDPTVDAIESVLRKPWHEIRVLLIREDLDYWRTLRPEDLSETAPPDLEWSLAESREYVQRQIKAAEDALHSAEGE